MLKWTEAQTEALKEHFEQGLSTRESAEALAEEFGGRWTKNMIIGRRHRLKLSFAEAHGNLAKAIARRAELRKQAQAGLQEKKKALQEYRRARSEKAKKTTMERACLRAEAMIEENKWMKPIVSCSDSTKQAVLSLKAHDCRYPFGAVGDEDFHFCGAPQQPGSSYCAEHHQLCSVVVPIRTMRSAAL
jgi:GcrA cell cycle regulator